ncbi:hypothetical protein GA0115246_107083 [Streptomyces sp. SolWspMP-sol7th]|nr:hypothetical protein GA0115246_107083 [Streptomyces sp. SolWspMP-sol7th]
MFDAASDSFVTGLHYAAVGGAVVLLGTAVAAWFLLKGQRLDVTDEEGEGKIRESAASSRTAR